RKHQAISPILFILILLCASIGQAQQPTNPAPAVLKSHIMLNPEEMKWEDCPPVLPAGAKCAVTEGDIKASNLLFAHQVKLPDNYRIPPHFHPADEHLV